MVHVLIAVFALAAVAIATKSVVGLVFVDHSVAAFAGDLELGKILLELLVKRLQFLLNFAALKGEFLCDFFHNRQQSLIVLISIMLHDFHVGVVQNRGDVRLSGKGIVFFACRLFVAIDPAHDLIAGVIDDSTGSLSSHYK